MQFEYIKNGRYSIYIICNELVWDDGLEPHLMYMYCSIVMDHDDSERPERARELIRFKDMTASTLGKSKRSEFGT